MSRNKYQSLLLKVLRPRTIVLLLLAIALALTINHTACRTDLPDRTVAENAPADNVPHVKEDPNVHPKTYTELRHSISWPGTTVGFSDADYARHMEILKAEIPDESFTTILEKPFIVIGDEPEAIVQRRSKLTIKWAVDMLKQDYFEKDPADIIDIWLFKDKSSYRKHTRQIFNETPDTPFGYYSHQHKALIMNIATGGGTLVHEIVHPFMSSNFPECPAWFNEGLASLYEQCRANDGHISGLTNWRLAGLQQDIDNEFYAGDNYAQARYLCYYLQEKGLLVKFYHSFCANQAKDPTGFETLKNILGEKDMIGFQKRWEEFVLKLTFP